MRFHLQLYPWTTVIGKLRGGLFNHYEDQVQYSGGPNPGIRNWFSMIWGYFLALLANQTNIEKFHDLNENDEWILELDSRLEELFPNKVEETIKTTPSKAQKKAKRLEPFKHFTTIFVRGDTYNTHQYRGRSTRTRAEGTNIVLEMEPWSICMVDEVNYRSQSIDSTPYPNP